MWRFYAASLHAVPCSLVVVPFGRSRRACVAAGRRRHDLAETFGNRITLGIVNSQKCIEPRKRKQLTHPPPRGDQGYPASRALHHRYTPRELPEALRIDIGDTSEMNEHIYLPLGNQVGNRCTQRSPVRIRPDDELS
jgi:hypothetical protein